MHSHKSKYVSDILFEEGKIKIEKNFMLGDGKIN